MFDRVLKTCLWYSVLIVFPVSEWTGPRSESFYSRYQQKLSSKQEPNLFHYSFWCSKRIVEDFFISLGEVSWYGNLLSGVELPIFEAYVRILLIVSLSLNQTLLRLLLYIRQAWMTQLILTNSLWKVIFLLFEGILVLICMVSQFLWRKDFLLQGTYL